jgi:hypothetical protein
MAMTEDEKYTLRHLAPHLATACDPDTEKHEIFKEILERMGDGKIVWYLREKGIEVAPREVALVRRYYTSLYD